MGSYTTNEVESVIKTLAPILERNFEAEYPWADYELAAATVVNQLLLKGLVVRHEDSDVQA